MRHGVHRVGIMSAVAEYTRTLQLAGIPNDLTYWKCTSDILNQEVATTDDDGTIPVLLTGVPLVEEKKDKV